MEEGAVLFSGSVPPEEQKGCFVSPVIFTEVDDRMVVGREEIFGPVASVFRFRTLDEVIRRANDSH